MSEKTYGTLKKRVFDLLFEYAPSDDTVFIADTDKQLVSSRMPDAVNSSFVRMSESLPLWTKTSIQKLHDFKKVFTYNGICDKDNPLEFELTVDRIGVFFKFFGKGNVIFSDMDGNPVLTIECEGSGSISCHKSVENTDYTGTCRVYTDGNLCVKGFAVYENDSELDEKSLCAFNETSFELPEAFDRLVSIEASSGKINRDKIYVCDGYGFIGSDLCRGENELCIEYKRKPYTVDAQTADDFVFDVTHLEFEALVCLVASELCRDENADLYARLVYKYNDLCEGIRSCNVSKKGRNTFFGAKIRRRW